MIPADFAIGERVQVHAMGRWYFGTVVSIAKKTVEVEYTSGVGVTRRKMINPTKIEALFCRTYTEVSAKIRKVTQ